MVPHICIHPCLNPPLSHTQVFANIAIVITEEESPSVIDWFTWRDVFHLVDIICCCAILFPIVWSIKHLREASQTDGKVKVVGVVEVANDALHVHCANVQCLVWSMSTH